MNTPPNISDAQWAQELSEGAPEAECEECGLGADCNLNGQLLCVNHAVTIFYDLLSEIVDPADLGFDVSFDVITPKDGLELEGFSATWFYYGYQEARITLLDLANKRQENEMVMARGLPARVVENKEKVPYPDMSQEDQDALKAVGWKGREYYYRIDGEWVDDIDNEMEYYLAFRTKLAHISEADERLSVCCGVEQVGDCDLCPKCKEHTEFVTEGEL